jgi:hypothetical protein
MVNVFQIIMLRVHQNIPPQILRVATHQFNSIYKKNYNETTFIQEHIIEKVVLPEVNLSGGLMKTIPLRAEWIENVKPEHGLYAGDDGPYSLFRIPPEARDNKPISNIISIQYPFHSYMGGDVSAIDVRQGGYCLIDQIDEVLNSYTLATPRNHPLAKLLAGDLIKITPSQYQVQNWLLTCRLDFDSSFNNLHDDAVSTLANLVMLAIKQWCYNYLLIDIDRAFVETGADIGTFKSIIEGYADAGQQFKEEMVQWRGAVLLSPEMRAQLLRYQL